MKKQPQFSLFRYQLLPITRDFQADMFKKHKTLDDLLAHKNHTFWESLTSIKSFGTDRARVTHKIIAEEPHFRIYRFAVSRRLDRETPDFRHEPVDTWPSFLVAVWNESDKQLIAVERRYLAFQLSSTAVRYICDLVNVRLKHHNLKLHWEPLFEQRSFWKVVHDNRGKLEQIAFELITPNMANISRALTEEFTEFAKSTNSATTAIKIVADPDSALNITEDNEALSGLVNYASKGGGNIALKLHGVKRIIHTSRSVKCIEISEMEVADPKVAVAVLKQLMAK